MNDILKYRRSERQVENFKETLREVAAIREAQTNELLEPVPRWKQHEMSVAIAESGLTVLPIGSGQPPRYLIVSPHGEVCLQGSRSSRVSAVVEAVANDKQYSKEVMRLAGIRVPYAHIVDTYDEVLAAFSQSKSVVVKPAYGSLYAGVTIDVTTEEELKAAWAHAREASPERKILIEDFVPGADLRINVAGGKVCVCYLRIAANVVGDGTRSIEQIVHEKNRKRNTLPGVVGKTVNLDDLAQFHLSKQNLTPASVLPKDEIVVLGHNPNYYGGADYYNVTDIIHPSIVDMVERAAKALGPADFWGFDVLAENFTKPLSERRAVICEANSRPNVLFFQYITHGQRVNNFAHILPTVSNFDGNIDAWPHVTCSARYTGRFSEGFEDVLARIATENDVEISHDISRDQVNLTYVGRSGDVVKAHMAITGWRGTTENYIHNAALQMDGTEHALEFDMATHFDSAPSQHAPIGDAETVTDSVLDLIHLRGAEPRILEDGLIEYLANERWGYTTAAKNSTVVGNLLAAKQVFALRALLMKAGVPVADQRIFRGRKVDIACAHLAALGTNATVTVIPKRGQPQYVNTQSPQFLKRMLTKRAENLESFAIAPQIDDGLPKLSIAVIEGQIVHAVADSPLFVTGDGATNLQNLLSALQSKITRSTSDPETILSDADLEPAAVPAKGEAVFFETSPDRMTFACTHLISEAFQKTVLAAFHALPDLVMASIDLRLSRFGSEKWVVQRMTSTPDLKLFAEPDFGVGVNIAEAVIERHILTTGTKWFDKPLTRSP